MVVNRLNITTGYFMDFILCITLSYVNICSKDMNMLYSDIHSVGYIFFLNS